MPASSRKRNKGKDRKAKQLAKKEENERAEANELWRNLSSMRTAGCDHGHAMVLDDHPVSTFMDQFILNLENKGMTTSESLREIFTMHRQIWTNESYRKLVLDILIRIGTNMMLTKWVDIANPLCVAQSIVALEHFNDTDDIDSVINERMLRSKWRDLRANGISSRRDALKFYRKRITCKCLKKIHLEARKTTPKTGMCHHCDEEMDRVSLSTCSRCMVYQYCSRECQVAGWPCHKEYCDYVKACQDDK
jgi:hypothetical protein